MKTIQEVLIMEDIRAEQKTLDCRYRVSSMMRQEIIRRRLGFESQASIAADLGIHQSTISRVMTEYLKSKAEGGQNYE